MLNLIHVPLGGSQVASNSRCYQVFETHTCSLQCESVSFCAAADAVCEHFPVMHGCVATATASLDIVARDTIIVHGALLPAGRAHYPCRDA